MLSVEGVASARVVKPVEKMADALRVVCPNRAKGCPWVDERNSLKRHLDETCRFFPCPHEGCTHTGRTKDLPLHRCPFESIECPQGCGLWGLRRGVEEHVKGPCRVTVAREEERLERERRKREVARKREEERLAAKQRLIKAAKAAKDSAVAALIEEAAGWVEMDIRGVRVSTSRSTLCKFPESILALFAQRSETNLLRINRDPIIFQALVHWLATGEETGCPQVLLELEKKFWGLPFSLRDLAPLGAQSLAGVDFSGVDLSRSDLRGVNLRNSRLSNPGPLERQPRRR